MWNIKFLTILRIFYTILFLVVIWFLLNNHYKNFFTDYSQTEFKIFLTQTRVNMETVTSDYVVGAILFLATLFCALISFPTIYTIFVLNVLFNPYISLFLVFMVDIFAYFITFFIVKFLDRITLLKTNIKDILAKSKIEYTDLKQLVFWMRVFPYFPLRFIDSFVASTYSNLYSLVEILPYIAVGSAIRFILHTIWTTYFLFILSDYRVFPDTDISIFLIISFVEFLNICFPLIPELAPVSRSLRTSIKELAYS